MIATGGAACAASNVNWHQSARRSRTERRDVFDGLASLQELDLGRNELTALPARVFGSLSSLETLSLLRNQLMELPAGVFDGLIRLERLSLSGNQLTNLPGACSTPWGAFSGCTCMGTS